MTIKYKNCGKPKGDHNAMTQECPKGIKHRTLGYTTFGPEKFEPKEKRYYRICANCDKREYDMSKLRPLPAGKSYRSERHFAHKHDCINPDSPHSNQAKSDQPRTDCGEYPRHPK